MSKSWLSAGHQIFVYFLLGIVGLLGSAAAQAPNSTQLRYVPHIVSGGGFVTKITITNLSSTANNVVVNTLSQAGALLTSVNYPLAPGGATQIATPEAQRTGPSATTWAIVGSDASVAINVFFECTCGSSIVNNTVGFNDSAPLANFSLPIELRPETAALPIGQTMGVALANVTGQNNTANLRLLDQNGNIVAIWAVNLSPFGQNAFSVASVPAVAAVLPPGIDFIGTLTVSSIAPVTALALGDDLGPFFSVPPVPGSAGLPPATTLRSLTISPSGAVLGIGQTRQYNVLGTYSDGGLRDITASVTWSSSASSVAGVSSAGIVSGAAAGSASISAQLGCVTTSVPVTVRVGGAPACDMTGTWAGTWTDSLGNGTFTETLTQTTSTTGASSVSGTLSTHNVVNGHDHTATIFGTLQDGTYIFGPVLLGNNLVVGSGTLNANCTAMSGVFTDSKINFGEVVGSLSGTKQ